MRLSKQRGRFGRWLPWTGWIIAVALQLPALGPYLHETDQAAFLAGAWRLALTPSDVFGATVYNYDKQYATYWIFATVMRLFHGCDVVRLGNILSFTFFWTALGWLLIRRPARTPAQGAVLFACTLAPLLLQHSAFLASNFISGGFVFCAAALMRSHKSWRRAAAVIALGASVAARADALLIVPAIMWLGAVQQPLASFVRDRLVWLKLAVAAAAFLLGRVLTGNRATDFYAWFFHANAFAAFAVFGLGAAAIAGAWLAIALATAAWQREGSRRRHRWFYVAGFLTLLPALAYYSVQMFSTRHWTVWLVSVIVLLSGRRAAALLGSVKNSLRRCAATACVAFALLPIGFGVHLPLPRAPRMVLGSGTRFPTADGNLTMGGYGFALAEVRACDGMVDHNHAVWLAARDFVNGKAGDVAVVPTPMERYFELAATLAGRRLRWVPAPEPGACVDSRSLLRPGMNFAGGADAAFAWRERGLTVRQVSHEFGHARILRFERGGALAQREREDLLLSELFHGNEFERLPAGTDVNVRACEGKTLVWWSAAPFTAEHQMHGGETRLMRAIERDGIFVVLLRGADRLGGVVRVREALASEPPQCAASVLMDYMSIDRFAR